MHSHDVSLVDSRHSVSALGFGVVECVASHSFGSFPGDELDGLNDTVDNLRESGFNVGNGSGGGPNIPRARYQSTLLPCFLG